MGTQAWPELSNTSKTQWEGGHDRDGTGDGHTDDNQNMFLHFHI